MKKIIYKIRFFIEVYIIFPIKRWWNFHIKGQYISDNIRNQALMEYCEKVIMDKNYQPQGAYEQSFEKRLHDCYDKVMIRIKEVYPDFDESCMTYEDERPYCAGEIYKTILQRPWINDL